MELCVDQEKAEKDPGTQFNCFSSTQELGAQFTCFTSTTVQKLTQKCRPPKPGVLGASLQLDSRTLLY